MFRGLKCRGCGIQIIIRYRLTVLKGRRGVDRCALFTGLGKRRRRSSKLHDLLRISGDMEGIG